MKLNKFFMGILGALALTACSSEEPVAGGDNHVDAGESRFMSVSIRNAMSSTRADDKEYEDGIGKESGVKNVIFYFFDKDGNDINVINGDRNYFICGGDNLTDPDKGSAANQNPNAEKILSATIVLSSSNNGDNLKDLYSMVAILNYDDFITPNKNMNLDDLKAEFGNYASKFADENGVPTGYADNSENMPYFVMTSSSYVAEEPNGDGSYNKVPTFLVTNIHSHVRDTEEEALADGAPVEIYVERLVSKVRLKTDWEGMTIVENVKLGDKSGLKAILVTDGDNKSITYVENGVEKNIYVVFEGWGLHGTAQSSWLFKRVNNAWKLDGWGDGSAWNDASYYRSYWAYNHTDVTATTLKHFPYEAANGVIGSDGIASTNFYCLENAADDFDNGTKSSYNPDTELSPRTQVFIKAKLVTLDADNNATVLKLAEWGGSKYVGDDVVIAMLGIVNNDIYIRKATTTASDDGTEGIKYEYQSIPLSMVKLVSGLESNLWTADKENDKRYLSYLMLKDDLPFPDGYEKAFYRDMKGTRYAVNADENATPEQLLNEEIGLVNAKLLGIIGAKVWENGKTYYYTDIRHLGSQEDKGLYGVVRNHVYDVVINTLTGLGTPVYNPSDGSEEVIIPQKPGQDAFFLGARVNILSWRVVPNNVTLDW